MKVFDDANLFFIGSVIAWNLTYVSLDQIKYLGDRTRLLIA
jgi:hypothetical protein